ncbi:hypothetical protein BD311DRAFT_746577 [Dichomitus squalens]|uniref:Secreted protein n=1 Tax=Dichomitus squalens TaxID=114155 RepID=A0A4Q9N2C1_9APHY|nr:hypothetical protein BD311DRAFT_746577 [Dichomitus squalens]
MGGCALSARVLAELMSSLIVRAYDCRCRPQRSINVRRATTTMRRRVDSVSANSIFFRPHVSRNFLTHRRIVHLRVSVEARLCPIPYPQILHEASSPFASTAISIPD